MEAEVINKVREQQIIDKRMLQIPSQELQLHTEVENALIKIHLFDARENEILGFQSTNLNNEYYEFDNDKLQALFTSSPLQLNREFEKISLSVVSPKFVLVPSPLFIKEKATEYNVYSMPEYFFRILGKRNGLMFTVFTLAELSALLIVNLIISGKILSSIFTLPYWASVIIGGAIILSYLLLAGFKAVVKTDFFQLVIMFVMSLSVAIFLFGKTTIGSVDFNFSSASIGQAFGFLVLAGLGIMVAPDLWQRVFASNDEKSLKKGLAYAGFILLILGTCITVLGLATRHAFPSIRPEDALVYGFSNLLPLGLKEFGIVLLYAVALSSSDTEIFVISSIITRDLKNYTKKYSEESMRKMTRFFMVVLVLLVSLVAIFYQNIISLGFSMASLNLALFPVVFASLYWKLKESAVFWSLVLTFAGIVGLFVLKQLTPETAVISLPVALFSLLIFSKILKPAKSLI